MNPLIFDQQENFNSPIIIALDFDNEKEVMNLIAQLDPSLCKLKVGKELFTSCGPRLVEKLVISGYKVFLDLKFHDIPNTVYKACKAASDLGIWMLNVHASGGKHMLEMAKKAIDDSSYKPILIAVTILTSMTQNDLKQIGIDNKLDNHIINLAKLTHSTGLDGVVCSAQESIIIKEHTAMNFLTISPGIRLSNQIIDDQQRIMTPRDAINNLVDYMVIGRPITQAKNPTKILYEILNQIK